MKEKQTRVYKQETVYLWFYEISNYIVHKVDLAKRSVSVHLKFAQKTVPVAKKV